MAEVRNLFVLAVVSLSAVVMACNAGGLAMMICTYIRPANYQ